MRKLAAAFFLSGIVAFGLYIADNSYVRRAWANVACSVPNNLQNGTTADASQVMANFNSLITCFTTAAAAGANSDITSLSGLTTSLSSAQGGTDRYWGGTSSGTNTVVVTTVTPASGFSLTAGKEVCFNPGGLNTGATTLNVNSTGAISLKRYTLAATGLAVGTLVGGELNTGVPVCAIYNGVAYALRDRIDFVGEIRDYASAAGCPAGWLEANGGSFVTANFPDINAALGTTWGVAGTLPDLRGRTTFNRDSGGTTRITAAISGITGTTVGQMGGQEGFGSGIAQAKLQSFNLTVSGITLSNAALSGITLSNGTIGSSGSIPVSGGAPSSINAPGTGANPVPAASSWSYPGISSNVSVSSQGVSNVSVSSQGTAASGGSGQSFSTLDPGGIVIKCVKL